MSATGSPRSEAEQEDFQTSDKEETLLQRGWETVREDDGQATPPATVSPRGTERDEAEEVGTSAQTAVEEPLTSRGLESMEAMSTSSPSVLQTSSVAFTERYTLSQYMEQLAESGETGAVTSSTYSGLHQFSQQLEESEDEDDVPQGLREEDGAAEEKEEDDASELVVLDPNHPLMTRFQTALKTYLTKQIRSLDLELREMQESLKKNKNHRDDIGVILYGIQQELARLQMGLEKQHDKHAQVSMIRRQKEDELEAIRDLYKKTHQMTGEERKKVSSMQTEVENLALRLFYMENMNQDVHSDISVMKRAVQKAEAERMQAEVEKLKQDMYIDRLTREADRLREQIALYDAQLSAQRDDTKAARGVVAEASMEIESIGLEKKQLFQQWNSSLIGMTRRDEAYAAVQEALSLARQELRAMDTEIESYKKSITKEEDRNEQLTFMFNRTERDSAMSKKLIAQCQAKQEALRVEFSTYMRTLQETEQALSRVTAERTVRLSEVATIRKQIEKESQVKVVLENQIMEKLQEKMTSDKATKYTSLLTEKLQKRKLDLEIEFAKVENDTAQVQLEINHSSSQIKSLQRTLAELEKNIQNTNDLISRSQSEIAKRTIAIERKQATINLFSKQIESTVAQIGGKELGPLEIQISALTKQIEECSADIASIQQYWLRLQTEMVRLTQQREEQDASVEMLKKELTILQQKKIRTENEIEQEKNEQKDIEHHMKNLRNDMLRLNTLISKNSSSKEQLQQLNQLMESEFMSSLRAAEKESVEMQENLRYLQEEKERMLHSLVETEHQIMLWEKKIQLAKEMRNAVDSEAGQGEIRAMKAEIHRMQVRHTQLMKQQEKMIRDMEAVVTRRETILTRGRSVNEKDKKNLIASEFRSKLQDLKKAIKETHKNIEESTSTFNDLQDSQKSLSAAIADKQHNITTLKQDAGSIELEIEQLQEKKRQNLSQIVSYQTRLKHLQAVKEGKYNPVCRTPRSLEAEHQKQESRIHTVSTIVHQIQQEYPQYQSALRSVSLALEARLGTQGNMSERSQ
ncbi:coiled-coil domain-containing protein 40 [Spea bombifrons]|uniref:coiled-coil domain-containing protein 40 n=1 Tax=Spea bombifrons TaxID=233779 RepID=UPI002349FD30|nr:coiled-coil domain-containing protein 40 [Spea bombifrons]